MIFKRKAWLVLFCWKDGSALAGRKFSKGNRIAVRLDKDLAVDGKERHGGVWGWARYTSEDILDFAMQVMDLRDFDIFLDSKKACKMASAVLRKADPATG